MEIKRLQPSMVGGGGTVGTVRDAGNVLFLQLGVLSLGMFTLYKRNQAQSTFLCACFLQ